jgi:uncharacterized protein
MPPLPEPRPNAAPDPWLERMRRDLAVARRDRDRAAVSALRTVLSAIANAEAPPLASPASGQPQAPRGPGEIDRLVLSRADVEGILLAEILDREDTIAIYERHGRVVEVGELRAQLAVLRTYQS